MPALTLHTQSELNPSEIAEIDEFDDGVPTRKHWRKVASSDTSGAGRKGRAIDDFIV
jgi:hypothetical protein